MAKLELIDRLKKDIAVEERWGGDMDSASWGLEDGVIMTVNEAKEVVALLEWKLQASAVMNALDLQAIGKEMNLGLGEDIAKNILPYIKNLKGK